VSQTELEKALAIFHEARTVQGCLPSTLATDARLIRAAFAKLGKPPAEVEANDLQRYVAQRAQRVRGTTLNRELPALRAFFRVLANRGARAGDLAQWLRPRRASPRPPLLLSQEDVTRLLAVAAMPDPKIRRSPEIRAALALRNRACLEILYGLGLRASEVAAIQVIDLDLISGDLLVRRAKRGENRRLPLPRAAVPHLTQYLLEGRPVLTLGGKGVGAFLVTLRGTATSGGSVLAIVKSVAARAGVAAHPHAFRRSLATQVVLCGASLPAVQILLGHASLSATQTYVSLDRDELRRAVEVLDRSRDE
jgi:site-specific recombinase XerD